MLRIALGPLWARVLAFLGLSTLWAAFFIATQWAQNGTIPQTVIPLLTIGIGTAAVWSAVAVSQIKTRYGHTLNNIDATATRTQALRAAFHGPIPTDPVVRNIAATIAAIRLHTLDKQVRRQTIVNALAAALTACGALYFLTAGAHRQAAMFGLIAAMFCLGAVATPWARRRVARRQMLLAGGPHAPFAPVSQGHWP